MTPLQLRDRLLRLLWLPNPAAAPDFVVDDAVIAINQAYQAIWNAPVDYHRSKSMAVTLISGQAHYELPANVQNVLGNLDIPGLPPLVVLRTRGAYNQFGPCYLGALTSELDSGDPLAYYVNTEVDNAAADSVAVEIWLAPPPGDDHDDVVMTLEVAEHAPRMTKTILCEDDANSIPIPHANVESILLPLALRFVSRASWFDDRERLPEIEADYQQAMAALGYANDPKIPRTKEVDPHHREPDAQRQSA